MATACSQAEDQFTEMVREHADRELRARTTAVGITYTGADFETEVYWGEGYFQTTIPYWVRLLGVLGEGAAVWEAPGRYEGPGVEAWG